MEVVSERREVRLRGIPVCEGVAIGSPFIYRQIECQTVQKPLLDGIEFEVERYRCALRESRREVAQLRTQLEAEGVLEGAAILGAHLQMLRDPYLTTAIEERIVCQRLNSEWIFEQAVLEYRTQFQQMADSYFIERLRDLHDVAQRVLGRLHRTDRTALSKVPHNSIVFAEDLVPSDTAEVDGTRVMAFVTREGGATSHAAILAKARGIPFVASVPFDQIEGWQTGTVIVDGARGEVILCASEATLETYRSRMVRSDERESSREEPADRDSFSSETLDGCPIRIMANIEVVDREAGIMPSIAEGIGLFRSEFLCMGESSFPTEERQYAIYRSLAESVQGAPVVIRLFDVGGDKVRNLPRMSEEQNPFLGCRAIRYMLKEPFALRSQMRAVLRATVHGQVKMLFPMVTTLCELREARRHLHAVMEELHREGIPFNRNIPIGCMIEVPSAAVIADVLARECDFLSIGTNDLIQYALAVDRGNQTVQHLYTPAHPSIVRLIHLVARYASEGGVPLSVCGEVASDPHYTALLIGLGVNELSMAERKIVPVQEVVRRIDLLYAHRLAEEILLLDSSQAIQERLEIEYRRIIAGELLLGARIPIS